ncbi:MAG: hypothetical protein JWM18_5081, partial [Chloroflexi bacterium]|nr:hypothetical protein [Chloroflexota bacterium]
SSDLDLVSQRPPAEGQQKGAVALQELGQRWSVARAGSVDEQGVAQLAACLMTVHDTP